MGEDTQIDFPERIDNQRNPLRILLEFVHLFQSHNASPLVQ